MIHTSHPAVRRLCADALIMECYVNTAGRLAHLSMCIVLQTMVGRTVKAGLRASGASGWKPLGSRCVGLAD